MEPMTTKTKSIHPKKEMTKMDLKKGILVEAEEFIK
jgi:hypothetical protein